MRLLASLLLITLGVAALAQTPGTVLSDPSADCPGFKPHHLCFVLPDDGVARVEFRSEPFYAIILRTANRCGIAEQERLDAQALLPGSKVFFESFECHDDNEDFISYTNVNARFSFMAVHAGATIKEARLRLAEVKATGRFPGANIRKMQAVLAYP